MHKFFFIITSLIFCTCALHAQDDTLAESRVYQFVEQMPEYPGGEDSLMLFLSSNIIYPTVAREANIEGRVVAEFIVLEDGRLTNLKIKKEIGGGCGDEVLRVLKLMPNWKSGSQDGKKVSVQYVLPVMFAFEKNDTAPVNSLSPYLNFERTKLIRKYLSVH